jgi:hypothetical protein
MYDNAHTSPAGASSSSVLAISGMLQMRSADKGSRGNGHGDANSKRANGRSKGKASTPATVHPKTLATHLVVRHLPVPNIYSANGISDSLQDDERVAVQVSKYASEFASDINAPGTLLPH